jgi:hypothetical protein
MEMLLNITKFILVFALNFAATMGAFGLVCCVFLIPIEHLNFVTSFRLVSVFAAPLLICILWWKLDLWGAPTLFRRALQRAGQAQKRVLETSRTARIVFFILMILTALHAVIQMGNLKKTMKEKPNEASHGTALPRRP